MTVNTAIMGKGFLDCVDACHKKQKEEGLEWDEVLKCVERCWRRHVVA